MVHPDKNQTEKPFGSGLNGISLFYRFLPGNMACSCDVQCSVFLINISICRLKIQCLGRCGSSEPKTGLSSTSCLQNPRCCWRWPGSNPRRTPIWKRHLSLCRPLFLVCIREDIWCPSAVLALPPGERIIVSSTFFECGCADCRSEYCSFLVSGILLRDRV